MTDYEIKKDDLIVKKNDRIDNAAYALMCAVVSGKDTDNRMTAVKDLADVLMPAGIKLEDTVNIADILAAVENKVESLDIPKPKYGNDIEWDMTTIAEVICTAEMALDKQNIPICHPFFEQDDDIDENDENYDEDNDGILCCLACDRCKYCPEFKEI